MQAEDLNGINQEDVVTFEEDIFFMGFTPLISIIPKMKDDTISEKSLQLKTRLKYILEFKQTYLANQNRLENFSDSHFINEDLNSDIKQALDDLQNTKLEKAETADEENSDENNEANRQVDETANDEMDKSIDIKSVDGCFALDSRCEDKQLSQLSKLKKELEAKTHVKKMYHNKLEVSQ